MPRHARLDVPGSLHHVMARGIEGTRIFRTRADREKFLTCIAELVTQDETRIPAWVLMDNHFHLLVFSGPGGLASFMRRLMTRYAVYFNKKHQRAGHLFQNRYKSVLCDEEPYFLELVRYIHLNPLRAGIVKTLDELDAYTWCGHSVIMGRTTRVWQDRTQVLRSFSDDAARAVKRYRSFIDKDKGAGKRPEFSGGGLVRNLGGLSNVLSLCTTGERVPHHARILGGAAFVIQVLHTAEQQRSSAQQVDKYAVIARICSSHGIEVDQLLHGSRRKTATAARNQIIQELVSKYGFPLTDVAGLIGISPSGVANVLKKTERTGRK